MDMINKPTEQAKAAVMQQPEVDQNLASEFQNRLSNVDITAFYTSGSLHSSRL